MSKHSSEDQTTEEETTVAPIDAETEKSDETVTDEVVDETDAVDEADEPT